MKKLHTLALALLCSTGLQLRAELPTCDQEASTQDFAQIIHDNAEEIGKYTKSIVVTFEITHDNDGNTQEWTELIQEMGTLFSNMQDITDDDEAPLDEVFSFIEDAYDISKNTDSIHSNLFLNLQGDEDPPCCLTPEDGECPSEK